MYGNHSGSYPQRITMLLLHLAALPTAWWLLFNGGLGYVSGRLGTLWIPGDTIRAYLLLAMALVYFIRLCFTTFYLLRRSVGWGEAFIVGLFSFSFHIAFTLLGGTEAANIGPVDYGAIGLYLLGSYLNTGSELQRHRWKRNPAHRGKLYTGGLFRYSQHINYFGDMLLFSGWALATRNPWAFLIPLLMTLGFVFRHIPALDRHLQQKYGRAFEEYSARTRKLIPWVY